MDTSTPATSSLPPITGPLKLLSQAWSLFLTNWKTLVPIAVLPSVVTYIGNLFSLSGHNIFFSLISFIAAIAGMVLSIVSVPALIRSIHAISMGVPGDLSLKTVYRSGFSLFWSVVFVGIIGMLVILGSTALLIVPGVIVGVYVGLYMYALSLDGKKGFSALIESYQLVRGRWVAVFGRVFFLGIVFLVVWSVIGAIVGVITAGGHSLGSNAFVGLVNVIVGAFMTPIAVIYSYNMYVSLKSTRQQEAPTTFKTWLVAFLCVGVVAVIAIPAVGAALFMGSRSVMSNSQIDLQRFMQSASSSPYIDTSGSVQGGRPGGAGK